MNQRPGAGGPKKLRGVHCAIVVENKDGDGNPGYRVRVTLPWLDAEQKTHWARIAVPMGGPDRGTYVLPEIDDQVLVVFEHGDIGRPIVIGALWSKQQLPVEINDSGLNNTKLIKSRAGHRMIFSDKEGAECVTLVDKSRKNKIVLDSQNKLVTIESEKDIDVIAKDNVILHAKAMRVGTQQNVTAKSKMLKGHAAQTFNFKAGAPMTVSGSQVTLNVNSSPACQVTGQGEGELGGVASEAPKEQVPEQSADRAGAAGAPAAAPAGGPGSPRAPSVADQPPLEPSPVLVSASWSKDKVPFGTEVKLTAVCEDMDGKSASFEIVDADDSDASVTTISATCSASGVEATWTTPKSGPPSRFVFEVRADGQSAKSGLLTLIQTVELTLFLDDEPAADVTVRLRVEQTGEELTATSDDKGFVVFEEAPAGDYLVILPA